MESAEKRHTELEKKTSQISEQMESQKSIIEQNTGTFYERKREKDNLSNERKSVQIKPSSFYSIVFSAAFQE